MNLMKKLICLMLVLSLFGAGGAGVFAAGAESKAVQPSETAVFDVTSLGIMQGDENGDLLLDQPLTRAEFAAVILNMLDFKETAGGMRDMPFADVKPDDWFAGSVALITQLRIMNGTSETEFEPNAPVTLEQAVKTLVIALGYGAAANDLGGYPKGHMIEGRKLKLVNGIDEAADFTRGALLIMIYNALDVSMMEREYSAAEDSYVIAAGNTIRRLLMGGGTQDVFHVEGVVNATSELWLDVPVDGLEDDEVRIDDVVYKIGGTNAPDYLGQEVELYADETRSGDYVLRSVRPTKNNTVTVLAEEDVESFDFEKLIYYGNDRARTLYLDEKAVIVKNGQPVSVKETDLLQVVNGTLTFIDNTGDHRADVILLEDYITLKVQAVQGGIIYFEGNASLLGKKFLRVDENSEVIYSILDTEGTLKTLEDIHAGDMLSIAADPAGQYYRMVICGARISGTITSILSDEMVIDDTAYRLDPTKTFVCTAGTAVYIRLDWRGRITEMEDAEGTAVYGYIQGVSSPDAFGGCEIRMLTSKQVENTTETDDEDADNTKQIPVLIAQNSGVAVFAVADKVRYGDASLSAAELFRQNLTGQAVEYVLNSKGEIRSLKPLELYGGDVSQTVKFNSYDMTFGGVVGVKPFAVDAGTQVICVPTNANPDDRDFMVKIQLGSKDFPRENFKAGGYLYDSETKKVKLLVIHDTMVADSVNTVGTKNDVGMVVSSAVALDEEGQEIHQIELMEKGMEAPTLFETAEITDDNQVLTTLQTGDLIYYLKDGNGRLSNAKVIESFANEPVPMYDLSNGVLCGALNDAEFDEIDDAENQLATLVTFQVNEKVYEKYIAQRNAPATFLYERRRRIVTALTSLQEAEPGSDMIYIVVVAGDVKACVLVR